MMEDRANILREMRVCRFCLSSDERGLTNIFDKHSMDTDTKHSLPLPLQIMACIAIEVFKNDGMPQLICNYCRKLTLQAYNFKTNCKKADDALKLFLATGQLSKPYLQKVEEMKPKEQPAQKKVTILNTAASSTETSASKRFKMEDGTEIITLNFTTNDDQNEPITVHPGENENETILGYEGNATDTCNEVTAVDDEDYSSYDEDQPQSHPSLKVKQVKTDCFPCPHCDRTFPLKQLLELHIPIHDRQRRFECEECCRRFFTKYDLQKHVLTHNGDKPYDCIVCNRSFSRESLLRRHEKIHNDVPKYVCDQCDRTFLTKQFLEAHQDKHKKKRPFTCQVCNKSFVFKQGLERHEVVHSENKPHKCNYCEASFTSAIKLTRHITSHAGLRPYPCKLCGRTFLLSHHLTRHMRSHYAIQSSSNSPETVIGQHKCDICSMSFRRKDSLINHSAIHSMVNLRCVICNTTFETAKMVKEHITTHLTGLPYPCEKCDYSFETTEQLEEHELKHAEMEYEEQIEKEVISEARQQHEESVEEYEEEEVTEYTITDINNPEVIPAGKHRENSEKDKESETANRFKHFLKDEIDSDEEHVEDIAESGEKSTGQEVPEEQLEPIKPIVRQEGTKVYKRKAPLQRKVPQMIKQPMRVAPLDQITQSDSQIENLNLSTDISSLPNKKFVNMKLGDKVVRVQKFIVTKEEMKAMAKQGILEMKGGQVVLKNPGQPVLNATLKPIQKVDIESLLDRKSSAKQQIKKYQARAALERPAETSLYSHESMDTS